MNNRLSNFRLTVTIFALLVLSACGGGGGASGKVSVPLTLTISGTGNVQSQPSGINCTVSCSGEFLQGTVVTLTATPGAGQSFTGWTGACGGASSTCVATLDQAVSVAATFSPSVGQTNYTLTTNLAGIGSVSSQPAGINNCTVSCSSSFPANAQVTLTATPGANQNFVGWTGACTGSAVSCVVVMSQVRTVGATFAPVVGTNFALNVSLSGQGSVVSNPAGINCGSTCSASFTSGTAVTLTAVPSIGHTFSSWSGACTGTQSSCTLQLTQVRNAQAVFSAVPTNAWQPAQLMESSNDFNIGGSQIAVNQSGDAIALWEQSDGSPSGSYFKVYSRRYSVAAGWQPAALVNVLPRNQNDPSMTAGSYLLLDNAGVATWIRENLETHRNSPATGWGAAFSPADLRISQKLTSAVLDASGNISVLRSGSDVENGVLPVGGLWQPWVRIDTAGSAISARAKLALSSNGAAIAIWRESNPGDSNYSMKAAKFSPSIGWGAPESIETLFTNVSDADPNLVMDDQGNGIAMWQQDVGSNPAIHYNIHRAGLGWQGEVVLNSEAQALASARTQLSMTPDGRAVATWYLGGGLGSIRSMQYNAATGGWTSPVTAGASNADRKMSIDRYGKAVMVSRTLDPSGRWDLVSQRLDFGGTWSAPTPVEVAAGSVENALLVLNSTGQGVAIWVQNDASNSSARNSLWSAVLR